MAVQENQSPWNRAIDAYRVGDRRWITPITEDFYYDMLGVVPPVYCGKFWGVGEVWHYAAGGEPIYLWFGPKFEDGCRLATGSEIKKESQHAAA